MRRFMMIKFFKTASVLALALIFVSAAYAAETEFDKVKMMAALALWKQRLGSY